jgi:hypothetical protein
VPNAALGRRHGDAALESEIARQEISPPKIDRSNQSSRLVLLPNRIRVIYGRGSFVDAVSQRHSFEARRGERDVARRDLCRGAAQG